MSANNGTAGDEADVVVCCEVLEEVLHDGWIKVAEPEPGLVVEVITDASGEKGIAINFCPFCGSRRPSAELQEA